MECLISLLKSKEIFININEMKEEKYKNIEFFEQTIKKYHNFNYFKPLIIITHCFLVLSIADCLFS